MDRPGEVMERHICNAYCVEQTHCDLVWTGALDHYSRVPRHLNPDAAKHYLAVNYWEHGTMVLRIEAAKEAPALADVPPEQLWDTQDRVDEHRWLVWWRERQDGDVPHWERPGYRMGAING